MDYVELSDGDFTIGYPLGMWSRMGGFFRQFEQLHKSGCSVI